MTCGSFGRHAAVVAKRRHRAKERKGGDERAQPRWLTAAIKAGAKRDDFLVDKSAAKKVRKKSRRKKVRRKK